MTHVCSFRKNKKFPIMFHIKVSSCYRFPRAIAVVQPMLLAVFNYNSPNDLLFYCRNFFFVADSQKLHDVYFWVCCHTPAIVNKIAQTYQNVRICVSFFLLFFSFLSFCNVIIIDFHCYHHRRRRRLMSLV